MLSAIWGALRCTMLQERLGRYCSTIASGGRRCEYSKRVWTNGLGFSRTQKAPRSRKDIEGSQETELSCAGTKAGGLPSRYRRCRVPHVFGGSFFTLTGLVGGRVAHPFRRFLSPTMPWVPHSLRRARFCSLRSEQRVGLQSIPM